MRATARGGKKRREMITETDNLTIRLRFARRLSRAARRRGGRKELYIRAGDVLLKRIDQSRPAVAAGRALIGRSRPRLGTLRTSNLTAASWLFRRKLG